ncbi:ATP-binding protein [Exiguobacterium sp. Helios]|uniref:AAA family ATPase n=1 Tax=Exiguobacterium sp. Helios TaxID=2735868 RepID=UPI00165DACC1|nr:ATP-binding protein [Exiguobacterium sp. Helios]QNR22297.1 ATP-binding protein [Exiguobacterium sp. Helios]
MKIKISHFKSLLNVSFDPGVVNVFIGSNGSGKSAILEALGVLSAAISGNVNDSVLYNKGVRLGTPSLYKSSFKDQKRLSLNIEFDIDWENKNDHWNYKVNLSNPIEKPNPNWNYYTEKLEKNNKKILGRSRASKFQLNNFPKMELDSSKGLLSFAQGIESDETDFASDLYDSIKDYAIYTPNTTTLRGVQIDPFQKEPLGLLGGQLSKVIEDLMNLDEELFGTMDLDDLLELISWTNEVSTGKVSKGIISPNVPTTPKTIKFTDRFMREGRNELTAYDASEGSLYVLFLLSLVMHESSPRMLAVDNFDQALNPRLARKVTKFFCDEAIKHNRRCFLTTHNPLVLDGLDLNNDEIRLFTVDRNYYGHTVINRVEINSNLRELGSKGYSLSELWIEGRLGGIPNI